MLGYALLALELAAQPLLAVRFLLRFTKAHRQEWLCYKSRRPQFRWTLVQLPRLKVKVFWFCCFQFSSWLRQSTRSVMNCAATFS